MTASGSARAKGGPTGGGMVSLVGAGPGDPGLLTLRGRECLETADVVVFDRLVDPRVLARARQGAELVDVGKVPGDGRNPQEDINALLVQRGREGLGVVRLKGGDPFVFGRGGEEALALSEAGIAFEVVPGVTSAVAACAYAGIPVTHRGLASSFTVVTGNEDPGKAESALAWDALARVGGTLVVLMGVASLPAIAARLTAAGRSPETPVALVRWGTEPRQTTVVGTLADIAERARAKGLTPPVVAVIGDVVALRDRLRWFDRRPLFGKRILVTRTRSQAGALSALLARRGADPIEVPSIELAPIEDYGSLDAALASLDDYGWVVFTSANAVEIVFERLRRLGLDARAFRGAQVAAIGPATADRLRTEGIVADFVPDTYVSEAVVEGLGRRRVEGVRVLLPRSASGREALTEGLTSLGARVEEVPAYRTVPAEGSRRRLAACLDDGVDIATFTSSSTVSSLVALLDGDVGRLSRSAVACIGPITAATARDAGLRVDVVAAEHTVPGLVRALEDHFARP